MKFDNLSANTSGNAIVNTSGNLPEHVLIDEIGSFDQPLYDPLPPETRERLLRFLLGEQDSFLLPLRQIAAILSLGWREVLPVPEMPRAVVGICSWRSELLWLIDLNYFAGYPSVLHPDRAMPLTVIVLESSPQAIENSSSGVIGLIVPQVYDVELHDLQQLQSPPVGLFSPELLPLIQGIVPGCSNAVLDLQPFIHCPLWKKHPKEEK